MADAGSRFHPELDRKSDRRTRAQVDRDRILYSTHFARLAEVTQVRSNIGDFVVHNRLTHSLKVAQVARRIAEALQTAQPNEAETLMLDPDVAEAAGLAHDLGHPPFGHIAEEKLDELVCEAGIDGYEGNAQTFRILTALAVGDAVPKDREFTPGLNLTRATLNAVLKYPWQFGKNPQKLSKWGSYKTETAIFNWAREDSVQPARSVEADIMDWADDVSYAVHDMVDFYCAGLIPLHLLASAGPRRSDLAKREWDKFFEGVCSRKGNETIAADPARFKDALRSVLDLASFLEPFHGSPKQTANIWRFSSELIDRLVSAIRLMAAPTPAVKIDQAAREITTILKQLTWHYVILRSDLATGQHGQKAMIGKLFEVFENAIEARKWEMFPIGFGQLAQSDTQIHPARWAADYISGLTERQVVGLSHRLSGAL